MDSTNIQIEIKDVKIVFIGKFYYWRSFKIEYDNAGHD